MDSNYTLEEDPEPAKMNEKAQNASAGRARELSGRAYEEQARCRAMPGNACWLLVEIQKASQRPARLDKAHQADGDCQGWGPGPYCHFQRCLRQPGVVASASVAW